MNANGNLHTRYFRSSVWYFIAICWCKFELQLSTEHGNNVRI